MKKLKSIEFEDGLILVSGFIVILCIISDFLFHKPQILIASISLIAYSVGWIMKKMLSKDKKNKQDKEQK